MEELDRSIDRSLMVDESDIDRLTAKLMKLSFGSSMIDQRVTKNELRFFTEQVLARTCLNRKFNEVSFEKGYSKLDPEKKGSVDFEKIRDLVENHFTSIGLHL